jgi:hypothetical protein
MFFDHLDERNIIVKSVTHFDNFIKWTFLVVNTRLTSLRIESLGEVDLEQDRGAATSMQPPTG